jgi:hypothetical protein
MRWMRGLVIIGLVGSAAAALSAQTANLVEYEIESGYVIAFPVEWDVTFDEGAIGGTNNVDYVYAYAPSLVEAPDGQTDPEVILNAVIDDFIVPNYPFQSTFVETFALLDGRMVASYDYTTLFNAQSINIRFMIVPLDDGTFGAVNIVATFASAQSAWFLYDDIVTSFNATNSALTDDEAPSAENDMLAALVGVIESVMAGLLAVFGGR